MPTAERGPKRQRGADWVEAEDIALIECLQRYDPNQPATDLWPSAVASLGAKGFQTRHAESLRDRWFVLKTAYRAVSAYDSSTSGSPFHGLSAACQAALLQASWQLPLSHLSRVMHQAIGELYESLRAGEWRRALPLG
jgi:hypothetical protein